MKQKYKPAFKTDKERFEIECARWLKGKKPIKKRESHRQPNFCFKKSIERVIDRKDFLD